MKHFEQLPAKWPMRYTPKEIHPPYDGPTVSRADPRESPRSRGSRCCRGSCFVRESRCQCREHSDGHQVDGRHEHRAEPDRARPSVHALATRVAPPTTIVRRTALEA